jgi:hypothetical protein
MKNNYVRFLNIYISISPYVTRPEFHRLPGSGAAENQQINNDEE